MSVLPNPPTLEELEDMLKDVYMAEVLRFEEKVREALYQVMKHAVSGHADQGYTTFCTNSDHALLILRQRGIRPVNEHVVEVLLDSNAP